MRHCLILLLTCLALGSLGSAHAEDRFPSGPVKLLVATAPGAGMDATARLVGEKLAAMWGKPVVVENKPGGSGAVAVASFKNARDTHTFLVGDMGLAAINPSLMPQLSYDPRKDFKPVTDLFYTGFYVVVRPEQFSSVKDLLAAAQKAPGKLNYGSAGAGSGQRLSMELLKAQANAPITYVPYRGNAPALTALLSGEINVISIGLPPVRAQLETGRLKAVAVTSLRRSAVMPDVPTLEEAAGLKGYEAETWVGLFAAPGLADEVVAKVQGDIAKVMQLDDVKAFMRANDYQAGGQAPAVFARRIEADRDKYGRLIKAAGITAE
jgi:tripartite-type tricarboxylate transporter receptor subunit TctC